MAGQNKNGRHVTIQVEEGKQMGANNKIKFTRMLSLTEKYQTKVCEDRIYTDDFMRAVSKNNLEDCRHILETQGISNEDYVFHPLLLAAKKGRCEIMELLLDNGADINVQDKKNFTALHYAIQHRSVKCCQLLLDKRIDTLLADKFGNLPLHVAAKEGILDIANKLLDINETPNLTTKKDQTPLHFAAMKGNDEILRLFLDRGERWDLKDINFWLPLHWAAFNGHDKCCEILIERSEDRLQAHINSQNKDKATPLILAAKKGHSRCCQTLSKADINAADNKGNTALHLATSVGFLKTVEVLLEMNPDLLTRNRDGNTPVHKAATQKNLDCLKILVERLAADPGLNFKNQTVIHLAAMHNCEDSLQYLLDIDLFRRQINARDIDGKTALHLALSQPHCNTAEILLNADIDGRLTDTKGNLALHAAAGNGLHNICKILLSGSRVETVNYRNSMGTTPLHLAAMNGSVACCKFLLTKGADLTIIDSDGFSPFHIASKVGNLEVIKLFTKKGDFVNVPVEVSGDSPLHLAARKGFYECCECILKSMKKTTITKDNNMGNSPLDEAFCAEKDDIFYLILSKIPYPNINENYNVEQYYPLQASLHEYMHEGIHSDRVIIQKAIVDSKWWYSGFSSSFCEEGQCTNLGKLMEKTPSLAVVVFDNCIEREQLVTIYNFKLLDDAYYAPMIWRVGELKRESSFSSDTGKLRHDAELFTKQKEHPLITAVNNELLEIMEHDLTKAFLNYKWIAFIRLILLLLVVFEFFYVFILGIYLYHVKNYKMLTRGNESTEGNKTTFCHREFDGDFDGDLMAFSSAGALFALSVIMNVGVISIEVYFKMKMCYSVMYCIETSVRLARVVGFVIFIVPLNFCFNDLLVKSVWQWQIGIITLLLSWFNFIRTMNEIPAMSVFMPVTSKFMQSFLKVFLYIVMIVSIFAFIFHLLLNENEAFKSWVAFVKIVVWLLGDLGYDDTFLDGNNPLAYPIMTNVIFIILVTTISGFIINMIIAQPTDHLDSFRERAYMYKVSSRIQLYLKIETVFDCFRRRHVVAFHAEPAKRKSVGGTPLDHSSVEKQSCPKVGKKEIACGDCKTIDNEDILEKILKKLDKIEADVVELQKK